MNVHQVDVDSRSAQLVRRHVRGCPACNVHGRPVCREANAMVEDALSMAGLYARDRAEIEGTRFGGAEGCDDV